MVVTAVSGLERKGGRSEECVDDSLVGLFDEIERLWVGFVDQTHELDPKSQRYKVLRDKWTEELNAAIPAKCRQELMTRPVEGDRWGRSAFDIGVDEIVYRLQQEYPDHPALLQYIQYSEYWEEFEHSKRT